ncbi:polysaccharide biosynthesis/export family protein [Agrobacterium sp. ES01]|uniref:polysaccharide biosynthesis/export family protein n=1 Tax=Agrobacterium sp. ES01 TaxID=3420714 RepID=UPI003D0A3B7E
MKNLKSTLRRRFTVLCMAGAAFVVAGSAFAQDGEYHLGVMDQLKIRVAQWQPAEGLIRDWEGVGGDYRIGPTGFISLPFVGEVKAAGRTATEVSSEIGERLQNELALRTMPSASVEIVEFGPIFLAGDVQTPGEYKYAPNLTVLKAVSLAGGLRRADKGQRFARDFISASGDAAVQDSERDRLLARQARLMAEINGSDEIKMPAELEKVDGAQRLIDSETALMKSRRQRYELQLTALADLQSLLQNEIESLSQKGITQKEQLDLINKDRERIGRLKEQGLTTSNRQLSIVGRAADVEGTLLDIDTATLRAKQDISKAKQDEINLRNDWEAQRAKELQDTEAELEKLALKLSTNRQLMSEALEQSAESMKYDAMGKASQVKYTIVRDEGEGPKEIAVDETVQLQPGDVVKVASEVLMQ